MEVVRQNKCEKKNGRDKQNQGRFWQSVYFVFSNRECNKQGERRDEQHRQMLGIPKITDSRFACYEIEFERSEHNPQNHKDCR